MEIFPIFPIFPRDARHDHVRRAICCNVRRTPTLLIKGKPLDYVGRDGTWQAWHYLRNVRKQRPQVLADRSPPDASGELQLLAEVSARTVIR